MFPIRSCIFFGGGTGECFWAGRLQETPEAATATRPGSEMERMGRREGTGGGGGGAVWLTLKVPLTLSPH